MRIKLLVLSIIIFSTLVSSTSGETIPKGLKIYSIDSQNGDYVEFNLTSSSVNYDMLLTTNNSYEVITTAIKSVMGRQSPYILNWSATEEIDIVSTIQQSDSIYVVVYSDSVMNGESEGSFELQGTHQVEETEFIHVTQDGLIAFQGSELVSDRRERLGKTEFKTYQIPIGANETLELLYQETTEPLALIVSTEKNVTDADNLRPIVENFESYINNETVVPSYIVGVFEISNFSGYIEYNFQLPTTVYIVVSMMDFTQSDSRSVIYHFNMNHYEQRDPARGRWYNRFIINILHSTPISHAPGAMILLIFVSMFTSSLSAFVTQKLLDVEQLNKDQKKINKYNKLKRKAQETAERALWLRLQKQEAEIEALQRSIMTKRMMPTMILSLPFIVIFQTFRGALGIKEWNLTPDRGGIVAILPFKVPSWFPLIGNWFSNFSLDPSTTAAGYGTIYFLSAIVAGMMLQRIFGINLQGARPENPFSQ